MSGFTSVDHLESFSSVRVLHQRHNVMPLSRERRNSDSTRTELNARTTSVPLVGCSGC